MAEKICTICKKHSAMCVTLVKLRGKYNPTTKTRKYPKNNKKRFDSACRHFFAFFDLFLN